MGAFDDYKSAFEQDASRLKEQERLRKESQVKEHTQKLEERIEARRQRRADERSGKSDEQLQVEALIRAAASDVAAQQSQRQQDAPPAALNVSINPPHTAQVSGNSVALTIRDTAGAAQAQATGDGSEFVIYLNDSGVISTLTILKTAGPTPV